MLFFASSTTRFLRYVRRTVLAYVQNAPGILVRCSRTMFLYLCEHGNFRDLIHHKNTYSLMK